MWEQMIDRAHRAFEADPGVAISRKNETFRFVVGDVLFRFKKGDRTGLSANFPTQTALAFHDPQRVIPGQGALERVEVVYTLNRLQTEVTDVLVVARHGTTILWTFSLLDAAEPSASIAMPKAPPAPVAPLVRPRVETEIEDDAQRD